MQNEKSLFSKSTNCPLQHKDQMSPDVKMTQIFLFRAYVIPISQYLRIFKWLCPDYFSLRPGKLIFPFTGKDSGEERVDKPTGAYTKELCRGEVWTNFAEEGAKLQDTNWGLL